MMHGVTALVKVGGTGQVHGSSVSGAAVLTECSRVQFGVTQWPTIASSDNLFHVTVVAIFVFGLPLGASSGGFLFGLPLEAPDR